jgi:hypothetical protein
VRWLRGDWNAESLNISCWAYRDVNRNGVYDVGDRSWVGLRVEPAAFRIREFQDGPAR